jgi:L-lactate dehydrogenase complex protein LldG
MSERDAILARIRQSLRQPAAQPGHASTGPVNRAVFAACLPRVDDSFDARLTAFRTAALELKADFELLADVGEMSTRLQAIRDAGNWTKVASHRGALTDQLCSSLNLPVLYTDQPYDKRELEPCDAAITECDALVAQTGSVLVTSRTAGGRALSVLPPHHIVLARREQLIADLPAAFALISKQYGSNYPSMISFITGPSRTGDIERILVLGAHGPKKLTILCA